LTAPSAGKTTSPGKHLTDAVAARMRGTADGAILGHRVAVRQGVRMGGEVALAAEATLIATAAIRVHGVSDRRTCAAGRDMTIDRRPD
jgi:hypothetical protein